MVTSAQLTHFKRLYKKIYSKEYHLVEQSLCELETEETKVAKTGFIPTVMETTNILGVKSPVSKAHQLLLTDPFIFSFSFSLLSDMIFYNTP